MVVKLLKSLIRAAENIAVNAGIAAVVLILALAIFTELDTYHMISDADSIRYRVYKPSSDDTLSFEELVSSNPDVIGWIMIDDTKIDYPIVQGRSNEEYINKDVFGEFSLSGAIFLDSRNSPGLTDNLSVIYGHNMAGDVMFGGLKRFADRDYFDSHRQGTIYIGGVYYRLEIFASLTANGHDPDIYRIPLGSGSVDSYTEHLLEISDNHSDMTYDDVPIILLSTCASGGTDKRTLVAAYMFPDGEPFSSEKDEQEKGGIFRFADRFGRGARTWHLVIAALVLLLLTVVYIRFKKRGRKDEKRDGSVGETV